MPFFDQDKSYFFHTGTYKLPFGRIYQIAEMPGASGIGPLAEVEHYKFNIVDFQMRGAVRAFVGGGLYCSGVVFEGQYGQSIVDDEATVQVDSLRAIVNDIAVNDEDRLLPTTWSGLDITKDNYLFVRLAEDSLALSDRRSSRHHNDFDTFVQDTAVPPDLDSMAVAFRASGVESEIETDLPTKTYLNLQEHHIEVPNPHGPLWIQDNLIVSGITVMEDTTIRGDFHVSGLAINSEGDIQNSGDFVWPFAELKNDVLFMDWFDGQGGYFVGLSGVDLTAETVVFDLTNYPTFFDSGALVGLDAGPHASGTGIPIHVFGDIVVSGNIVFPGDQFIIDGERPSLTLGPALDRHLADQNPHMLTPVRLSGIGRLGVGDPNQWGVDPYRPLPDSLYWKMQGDWPVSSGVALDGIDFSAIRFLIDGAVADAFSTPKEARNCDDQEFPWSVWSFDDASGSEFTDRMDGHDFTELSGVEYGLTGVSPAFSDAGGVISGVSFIRTPYTLPEEQKTPFTFSQWVKGRLDNEQRVLATHQSDAMRGWHLLKDGDTESGVKVVFVSPADATSGGLFNHRGGLLDDDWNFISLVYDGEQAYLGVNGLVVSGVMPINGWAGFPDVNQPHHLSVLSNPKGLPDGYSNFQSLSFETSDWVVGGGGDTITMFHNLGSHDYVYRSYQRISGALHAVDTVDAVGDNSLQLVVAGPPDRFDGLIVLAPVGGSLGLFSKDIVSGTNGWDSVPGGFGAVLAHNFADDRAVAAFYQGAGATKGSVDTDVKAGSFDTTSIVPTSDDRYVGKGVVLHGSDGLANFFSVDFAPDDWAASGNGGGVFSVQNTFGVEELLIDVWRKNFTDYRQADALTIHDTDQITIVVNDFDDRFAGRMVVGDGGNVLGTAWSGASIDETSYQIGFAWPQFINDYDVPEAPWNSPMFSGNDTAYFHQHLMLPPEGHYVSIAPEYPNCYVSGESPGMFETRRYAGHNWYSWYSYEMDQDVVLFTKIPVPVGAEGLNEVRLYAGVSPGGENLSKFQIRVRDTRGANVNELPQHWLFPFEGASLFIFSGIDLADTFSGEFRGGQMAEAEIRMRSADGLGIHIGPMTFKFIGE